MAYGKDAAPITSQTTHAKRAYLDARVARWDGTRADIINRIVDFWFALGAPPVNVSETYMPPIPIPVGSRVELESYWADFVPFDVATEGNKEATNKKAAARLLKRPHRGRKAESEPSETPTPQSPTPPNHV